MTTVGADGSPSAQVVTIDTPELGDRSYLVHDGTAAVVVDPQRDVDRVLAAASAAGVTIACVAETHLHNDYVSGGRELAALTDALHLIGGGDAVEFPCRTARDGDEHRVGSLQVRPLATPGHTPDHVAYAVDGGDGSAAVFTGGSLLFGTVGRTDLVGAELAEGLTREQYRSVRHLAEVLGDGVGVWPTHGFGSFCSSTPSSDVTSSTIGDERRQNLVFCSADEDAFVDRLLSGLTAYPRYYAHMGPINRAGPSPIDLSDPATLEPEQLEERIRAGEWVVDLRDRRIFAAAHVPGTIGAELATSFSTFLGWAVPWGTPITLIGDRAEAVAKAQRDLARIGIDRPAGIAVGEPDALSTLPLASYPVGDFAGLRRALESSEPPTVLDVRRDDEWEQGRVEGALHIHFSELEPRMDEVPDGSVWVYCATGYRSSVAAGLLQRAGRHPVLIDDDWTAAGGTGLPITR